MTIEPINYEYNTPGSVIKVIGIGGGGGNAVSHMIDQDKRIKKDFPEENSLFGNELAQDNYMLSDLSDDFGRIEYYAVNTDAQALRTTKVPNTVQIGGVLTRGLGAGSNPNVGRKAAEEDREALRQIIEGADMVFIAAGMGGGTGTGAAPVVAQIAKELNILTVAVVTKPFHYEGRKKMHFAELGIKELSQYVDSLIIIPNDKLIKVLGKNITVLEAFKAVNEVLHKSVTGISDMITSPGIVNVDFEDVKTVMSQMGRAMMGNGFAKGKPSDDRAEKAIQEAIASPLLEDVNLQGAKGILINVASGLTLGLGELDTISSLVHAYAAEDAIIKVGTSFVADLDDAIRVTLVATGIGENETVGAPIRVETQLQQPQVEQNANVGVENTLDIPTYNRKRDISQFDVSKFTKG